MYNTYIRHMEKNCIITLEGQKRPKGFYVSYVGYIPICIYLYTYVTYVTYVVQPPPLDRARTFGYVPMYNTYLPTYLLFS